MFQCRVLFSLCVVYVAEGFCELTDVSVLCSLSFFPLSVEYVTEGLFELNYVSVSCSVLSLSLDYITEGFYERTEVSVLCSVLLLLFCSVWIMKLYQTDSMNWPMFLQASVLNFRSEWSM